MTSKSHGMIIDLFFREGNNFLIALSERFDLERSIEKEKGANFKIRTNFVNRGIDCTSFFIQLF
jgi:hypothetical protein